MQPAQHQHTNHALLQHIPSPARLFFARSLTFKRLSKNLLGSSSRFQCRASSRASAQSFAIVSVRSRSCRDAERHSGQLCVEPRRPGKPGLTFPSPADWIQQHTATLLTGRDLKRKREGRKKHRERNNASHLG